MAAACGPQLILREELAFISHYPRKSSQGNEPRRLICNANFNPVRIGEWRKRKVAAPSWTNTPDSVSQSSRSHPRAAAFEHLPISPQTEEQMLARHELRQDATSRSSLG